ncbi:MAG: ABC transporter ATP-binding protein [Candidatus Margulisiibacteriota bacterium]|nr:MAG: ABC transporter ATP-binding protein [Candidatus Margulisiibacteriota bacterium]
MKNKNYSNYPLLKLLPYLRSYKRELIYVFAFIAFLLTVQLVRPLLIKLAIDKYIMTKNITGLTWVVSLFIVFLCLEFLFSYAQTYYTELVSQKIMAKLRLNVFQKIEHQSMSFFDKNKVGGLISRITTDIDNLEEMFTTGLIDTVIKLGMILIIIVIIFYLNVKLALFTIACMPVTLSVFYLFSGYVIARYRELRRLAAQFSGYLQENIGNMKIIQVFNQEERHKEQFREINRNVSTVNNKIIFSFALLFPMIEISSSFTTAAILWYGGLSIFAGLMTIGTLIAFLEYVQKLFNPLKEISERYNVIQSATASAERIFGLLESSDHLIHDGTEVLNATSGAIDLNDVWFAYIRNDWVIKGLSLSIQPGEKIAIIGATGSGKSTILKLLLRFYELQKGSIRIDGHDIRELTQHSLRSKFGYITQDPYLFSDTVANNIRLFDQAIDHEAIQNAAGFTGSASFIERLPDTYSHVLSERGSNLSVGEKQLLSLSRLAAINPPIFMLDEATAHIDVVTEALIEDNLQKIMESRTSIVVAHRLSTIKSVDRIIVMDKGRIVEDGKHEDLLARKGFYYTLYKYQYKFETAIES